MTMRRGYFGLFAGVSPAFPAGGADTGLIAAGYDHSLAVMADEDGE